MMVTPRPVELDQVVPDGEAALGVEACGGLVKEEEGRAVHQGAHEVDAAPHAAGVGAHLAVCDGHKADEVQQVIGAAAGITAGEPIEDALKHEEVAAGR